MFVSVRMHDVRIYIRHLLCAADRVALARTCRTLYDEDSASNDRGHLLTHYSPPAWRACANTFASMVALVQDEPLVHQLMQRVFAARLDDIPYCCAEPPSMTFFCHRLPGSTVPRRACVTAAWPLFEVTLEAKWTHRGHYHTRISLHDSRYCYSGSGGDDDGDDDTEDYLFRQSVLHILMTTEGLTLY